MSKIVQQFDEKYQEYLKDESKLIGQASAIALVNNLKDLRSLISMQPSCTIQGSRSGICGGATPYNNMILSMTNLNNLISLTYDNDAYYLKVEAGLSLLQLNEYLTFKNMSFNDDISNEVLQAFKKDIPYFWPVNPTEQSASIGGIIACDAKGTYHDCYGSSTTYVSALSLLTSTNELLDIKRGQYLVKDHLLTINNLNIEVNVADGYDFIDLVIGSEGIFGIIIDATLKLIKRPTNMWGLAFNFKDDYYLTFIDYLNTISNPTLQLAAMEFIDENSLNLFNSLIPNHPNLASVPSIDVTTTGLVYLELHSDDEEAIEELAFTLMEYTNELGLEEDDIWALVSNDEIEKFNTLRHAIPENINVLISQKQKHDKRITKLSSDIYYTNESFSNKYQYVLSLLNKTSLEYYCFGHLKGAHFHLNIIAKDYVEYLQGKTILNEIYANTNENNITFEHGVGKLKKDAFKLYQAVEHQNLSNLKKAFDPKNLFNQGNVL